MPKWSCKPILNINVPRAFQWYKESLNPMRFDPCNRPLKIWKSTKTPTPKMRTHLGVWGSFPHTLLHFWEHEMWLPGFTLGSHLCKPKARVVTPQMSSYIWTDYKSLWNRHGFQTNDWLWKRKWQKISWNNCDEIRIKCEKNES